MDEFMSEGISVPTYVDQIRGNPHENFGGLQISFAQILHQNAVVLLLTLAIFIRLPLAFLPLTYSVTDTWRQADTASIAHNFMYNGNILYPQINWGGNGPGYVESEFQIYTFLVSKLYNLFGEQVIIGRLISLLFTGIAIGLVYLWVQSLVGKRPALWALFFLSISPLSIRYSVTFMPEATVFLFYMAALYLFDKWLKHESRLLLLLTAFCTALMILVKPTSIHIGLIFLLLLLKQHGVKVFLRIDLWAFAVISILPSVLWYLHARELYLDYGNTFGVISGGDSKLGNFSYWLSPMFYFRLISLDVRWILAITGIIPFLIGLRLAIHRRQPLAFILGCIVVPIYYLIVARYAQEEWGVQYHIYALPYVALGVGMGFDWLLKHPIIVRSRYVWISVASVILMVIWSAHIYKNELLVPTAQPLWDCAQAVAKVVPESSLILVRTTSVSIENGVPNNYEEPEIFFYSHRNGWSLPADWDSPEQVEKFRKDGANYLIIPYSSINPALNTYLQDNSIQVGPGIDAGCGIYQFG